MFQKTMSLTSKYKGGCLIYCTKPATVGASPANDTGFFLRFFMSITKILGDNR